MLFVEFVTDQLTDLQKLKNKNTIAYYINPITDINILKQELKELKQVTNDINKLDKDINYLNLFNMELEYITETHQQYYKTDVIIDNNNLIVMDPDFKKYSSLIKKELQKIIKILENQENKPDKKIKNKKNN